MIDGFKPQILLAFLHPQSVGTIHCVEYAVHQGVRVIPYFEGFR